MRMGLRWMLAAAVAVLSAVESTAATPTVAKEATEDNARITVPGSGCVLANNVWDRKSARAGFTQSVLLDERGLPGWRWSAPGGSANVLSMPEIICGDKPWDDPLGLRKDFPFVAGKKRLSVSFDADLKAEGRYNMAFSLWAVSKLPAVKQNISLEIMVWTVDSGAPHAGTKVGSLDAGGTSFDVYVKSDQGVVTGPDPFTWSLVNFIAQKPLLKGEIDFGVFVDYLIGKGMLARDHHLTSLELGTEVWEGTGSVAIRKFDMRFADSPR